MANITLLDAYRYVLAQKAGTTTTYAPRTTAPTTTTGIVPNVTMTRTPSYVTPVLKLGAPVATPVTPATTPGTVKSTATPSAGTPFAASSGGTAPEKQAQSENRAKLLQVAGIAVALWLAFSLMEGR